MARTNLYGIPLAFCTAKPNPQLARTPQGVLDFTNNGELLYDLEYETHIAATSRENLRHLADMISGIGVERANLPWDPDKVILPILEKKLAEGTTPPVIMHMFTAINGYHVSNDFDPPRSRRYSMFMRKLRKSHKVTQATPASTAQVLAMVEVAATQPFLEALRDQALLLLLYVAALRPGDISQMRRPHLTFHAGGVTILIPKHKSDPWGGDPHVVTIQRGGKRCPVAALEKWLPHLLNDVVFPRLKKPSSDPKALISIDIIEIVKRYAKAIGMKGKLTSYTMRRGHATTAHQNDVPLSAIQRTLRHGNSQTTEKYINKSAMTYDQSLTRVLLS